MAGVADVPLRYHVDWPLNVILDEEILEGYEAVCRRNWAGQWGGAMGWKLCRRALAPVHAKPLIQPFSPSTARPKVSRHLLRLRGVQWMLGEVWNILQVSRWQRLVFEW